ncbi:MAG TPA: hypothetical protein VFO88_01055, partial [Gaiellaceae bacterium]|nr:hypothetical protein [Gaiellaceae bacterium]
MGSVGALAFLLGRGRLLVAAGLLALGVAEALVAQDLLPDGIELGSAVGLAALAVGAPLLALLAVLFVHRPAVLVPAVVGTAWLRWPFEIDTTDGLSIGLG